MGRYGGNLGLDYLSYMEEDGVKIDFIAAAIDEENESYLAMAGIVADLEGESWRESCRRCFRCWARMHPTVPM